MVCNEIYIPWCATRLLDSLFVWRTNLSQHDYSRNAYVVYSLKTSLRPCPYSVVGMALFLIPSDNISPTPLHEVGLCAARSCDHLFARVAALASEQASSYITYFAVAIFGR